MSILQGFREEIEDARQRVLVGSRLADTARGSIEYVVSGDGPPVLWVHGVVGGADQGPIMSRAMLGEGFRVISVSRFGYLRSSLPPDGTPVAQADLYADLLDTLGIRKVALVGASAGGPSSLQFALRHPDRCSALALWSMAVPGAGALPRVLRPAVGAFFGSDLLQWMIRRYRPSLMLGIMGVPSYLQPSLDLEQRAWLAMVMSSFFPFAARIRGILNDVFVTVPDLRQSYPLERMVVPTLIVHATDDPMPPFSVAQREATRMPGARFVRIERGGHLLIGHHAEVRSQIGTFLRQHVASCVWSNE